MIPSWDALNYVRAGWLVLPCRRGDKRPASPHGLRDATKEPEQVARYWKRWPNANIGLVPPAEVLVIDVDSAEVVTSWEARFPELAGAPMVHTPRGGAHFYLHLPAGASAPSTRTRIKGEPVDIRGLGKTYLVAPPSRTRVGHYCWVRPLVPPDALPAASGTLLEVLAPQCPMKPSRATRPVPPEHGTSYARVALRNECNAVASAQEGARNDTLNRAAFVLGQLVAVGMLEQHAVEEALLDAALTSGLLEREARATVRSGLKAGLQKPRVFPLTCGLTLKSRRYARWRLAQGES